MPNKGKFWETLGRIRLACWAINAAWQVAAIGLMAVVFIFGYIQSIPVSFLIPAAVLTAGGVVWLARQLQSGAIAWHW